MDWERVCDARDVGREPARFTLRSGDDVVLVRRSGELLAISNRCPHKDASLHRSGDIEDFPELGPCIRCPKHQRKFGGGLYVSLKTGTCTTRKPCSKSDKVARYSVLVYEAKETKGSVHVRPRHSTDASTASEEGEGDRDVRLAAEVDSILKISPDSYEFKLQLSDKSDFAEFEREPAVTWHIWLHVRSGSSHASREYTPVSGAEETARTGAIRLVVKLYPDGEMSALLRGVEQGRRVEVSAPMTTLRLRGLGGEAMAEASESYNLLAGGTGIAPCLQLARRALDRKAAVRLVYCVRRRQDVLLEDEVASLSSKGLHYAVVFSQEDREGPETPAKRLRPSAVAHYYGQHVDKAIVQKHLIGFAETHEQPRMAVTTVISGPKGFNDHCAGLARGCESEGQLEVHVLDA